MSLNQIIARIRSLALSHKQVNSFYFGDPHEFDANGDIIYAGCFAEQISGSLNRNDHLQRFGFRIYFLDRVGVSADSEGNETEVLSDMSSVAADYMAMLNSSTYQDDWIIDQVTPVTPVTEQLNDLVAGVYIDVFIGVDYLVDRCQVPADDVTFESDFDMAITKILQYTGTGLEGDSFAVPGLALKVVLAVYRAGDYKRTIITTPTDSDKIRVTGTDLGSNKGILSSDGTVRLQSGDSLTSGEVLDFLIYSI